MITPSKTLILKFEALFKDLRFIKPKMFINNHYMLNLLNKFSCIVMRYNYQKAMHIFVDATYANV